MIHYLIYLVISFSGAAVSLGLAYWTACFILLFWIWFRGLHKDTWGGIAFRYSFASNQKWGYFAAVSVVIAQSIKFNGQVIRIRLASFRLKLSQMPQFFCYQTGKFGNICMISEN